MPYGDLKILKTVSEIPAFFTGNEGMEAERRGWGQSKKGGGGKIFWYPAPKKTQPGPDGSNASGGRLPWVDFAVIGVHLCSPIIAIFPCVHTGSENDGFGRGGFLTWC